MCPKNACFKFGHAAMYPSSKIALLRVTGMRQLVKGWTVEPYIGQCLKYDNAWSQTTCPSAITSIARDDDIARNLQLDETINNCNHARFKLLIHVCVKKEFKVLSIKQLSLSCSSSCRFWEGRQINNRVA